MKADLHIHTTISDGSDTIGEIISLAKEKELDAIVITDHDTIAHFQQIPAVPEIYIGCGIEISSIHSKTNTRAHVLGYRIQNPDSLAELTQPLLEERDKNSRKQVAVLKGHGYDIDTDKLKKADGKYLYKQHIMDWLVTTGQAPDMFGEFYQRIFKNSGICDFDIKYIDAIEAVKAIKEAGGLAVLAHPGQQQNYRLIAELVEAGLDGIELNHHTHSVRDRDIVREFASRFGLFMTGGSDYHGIYEPQPFSVGDLLADNSGAEIICNGATI